MIEGDLARPAVVMVARIEAGTHQPRLKNWNLRLLGLDCVPLWRSAPLEQCFPEVPRLSLGELQPESGILRMTPEELAAARNYQLDFILNCLGQEPAGELAQIARYGIWFWRFGEQGEQESTLAALRGIIRKAVVTNVLLCGRISDGRTIRLQQCSVKISRYSFHRMLDKILDAAAHLPRWQCAELTAGVEDSNPVEMTAETTPAQAAVSTVDVLKAWRRQTAARLARSILSLRLTCWNVGLVRAARPCFLDPAFKPEVEWLPQPRGGSILADPFPLPNEAQSRWLAEEIDRASGRGRIVEIRLDEQGGVAFKQVIAAKHSLSYPCVFEYEGRIFCLIGDETEQAVKLHVNDSGRSKWCFHSVLIEGVMSTDATIFPANGSWWIMHSSMDGQALYLWNAPTPLGPWQPHPANPVKIDVGSARPAGTPFWHEGKLYRPAQDGTRSYGSAVVINRIDCLSLACFRETVVRRVEPDPNWPYPDGIHTLTGWGEYTLVDGKRYRWAPDVIVTRIILKLSKALGRRSADAGLFTDESSHNG